MKISYNWLKSYIPDICEPEKLWDVFTFHLCEVESMVPIRADGSIVDPASNGIYDWVFDINILPNRAHDLLSHQGVAQELSALLDIEYKSPVEYYKVPKPKKTNLKIEIESEKCRRYMGRVVRNVKIGPSPDWVVKHLESIGQKSINNVVDATNIVMFDCGNPTHVFDAKKVGEKIIIKEVDSESKISLLGGEEKVLDKGDLTIQDGKGSPLAIAGVKGGKKAEVESTTTDIIIEVANFEPVSTRKTGRRLALFTDALKRFENDLSPVRAEYAMLELSALIAEMCPEAEFEEIVDVFKDKDKWETKRKIEVSSDYINSKLGTNFSVEEIESVWKRMKFSAQGGSVSDGGSFIITVPSLRLDLEGPHDLVEEVGRVIGFEKVEGILPKIGFSPNINHSYAKYLLAKKNLTEKGFKEVMTYSLVKKGKVELAYAPKGKEAMRKDLATLLKEAYDLNKNNAPLFEEDAKNLKIFEIGDVYPQEGEEVTNVAFVENGNVTEMSLEEFVKEDIKEYENILDGLDYQNYKNLFTQWSLFPFITRDVSVWVEEGKDSDIIENIIKENLDENVLVGPTLIDSFSKDGRNSYAFRLVFQSKDRTLTDEEIAPTMDKIYKALSSEKGVEIR
ncbi:phenylalanine--tRNA ligase subunit beta [Candidatus Nomurabacteria bacterium]|nr:phenylalanine--tRNA ligase subunit beta [Candidatus Nomurabacteria bacterium]